jgi:hypothetical protein
LEMLLHHLVQGQNLVMLLHPLVQGQQPLERDSFLKIELQKLLLAMPSGMRGLPLERLRQKTIYLPSVHSSQKIRNPRIKLGATSTMLGENQQQDSITVHDFGKQE